MLRRAFVVSLVALLLPSCHSAATPSQPISGGQLSIEIRDLGSLDPAKASGPGAQMVVAQLFRSLTWIDPATGAVQPGAASKWTTSKTGLVWRFTIAPARFSNGATVTAADFKFAFDRIARKATRSDVAFQLENVKGFAAVHDAGTAKTLSGVVAANPSTLVITLARPYAELPYALAHPRLGPLPARVYATTTRGLQASPIANGPFTVRTTTLGSTAILEHNRYFAGRTPYLASIEFRVSRSIDDGWRAYTGGEVQVAEVPVAVLQSGGSFGQGGFTPAWATLSFGANLTLKKYKNPSVRRALSLAIDRAAIANSVYGGTKSPATGIVPDGVRGASASACDYCTFERDRARARIKAIFKSAPPSISIDYLAETSSRAVARAVQAAFQAIGIRTTLRAHTADTYGAFLASGKQDFAQLGWLADVPSPDGFLAQQLRSGSPNNEVRYRDKTFDALIDRARAQGSEAARLKLYRQAERRALSSAALIPIVFFRNRTAVAARVHGFVLTGAGTFDGTAVWLGR